MHIQRAVFWTLADPTRLAIVERLPRDYCAEPLITAPSGATASTLLGFRPQDEAGCRGMGGGGPRILGRLKEAAARV